MKKIYILVIAIVIVFIGISSISTVKANPSTLQKTYLGSGQGIASSTASYVLTGVATTTFVAVIDGQDQFDLNIATVASSSAIVNFQIDYSDDYACNVTGVTCNWYREDKNTVSGAIVTHTGNTFHTWTPGSATSTKNISFTSVGARFVRVGFAAQTGNSTIWAEVASKGQRN